MNAQKQVAENTVARGYRDGWTAEQFAARQVCKLVEELNELDGSFNNYFHSWRRDLNNAAIDAKLFFDGDLGDWNDAKLWTAQSAKLELADIQVVVFNLAQALAEITGEPFDVIQAAVDKSAADVTRGVR